MIEKKKIESLIVSTTKKGNFFSFYQLPSCWKKARSLYCCTSWRWWWLGNKRGCFQQQQTSLAARKFSRLPFFISILNGNNKARSPQVDTSCSCWSGFLQRVDCMWTGLHSHRHQMIYDNSLSVYQHPLLLTFMEHPLCRLYFCTLGEKLRLKKKTQV